MMDAQVEVNELQLGDLHAAVNGRGAALRMLTRLQPAGGPGDKVFPPTYVIDDKQARTKYAVEKRRIGGTDVDVVLLDSVASQANRMEEALFEAWQADATINFPVMGVDFSGAGELADLGFVSALHAPHRIADALLRDALTQDDQPIPFRDSPGGRAYTQASIRNASAVYRLCPTALIFGVWNSTTLVKGEPQNKFQRCVVSEIVGIGYRAGQKVGSRLDPTGIENVGTVYHRAGSPYDWTLNEAEAFRDGIKILPFSRKNVFFQSESGDWQKKAEKTEKKDEDKGKVTSLNHSNIPPKKDDEAGGTTFDYAQQTTVLSLPALRKLRFATDPDGASFGSQEARLIAEGAARTALAALALAAVMLARDRGLDLRSRAALVTETGTQPMLELVPSDGSMPVAYHLSSEQALELLNLATVAAQSVGMPWTREPLRLTPMPKLVSLIRESRRLAAASEGEGESGGAV